MKTRWMTERRSWCGAERQREQKTKMERCGRRGVRGGKKKGLADERMACGLKKNQRCEWVNLRLVLVQPVHHSKIAGRHRSPGLTSAAKVRSRTQKAKPTSVTPGTSLDTRFLQNTGKKKNCQHFRAWVISAAADRHTTETLCYFAIICQRNIRDCSC